ncbi:MAG: hypothetical protein ACKVOE_05240, partial [Rickettsiales bacterium]
MMEPNEQIQPWAALVNSRALAVFKKSGAAKPLAAKMQPPAAAGQVENWLRGRDVPRTEEQHAALMRALDLPETEADVPMEITGGPRLQKAQLRSEIDTAWETAFAAVKDAPEVEISTRLTRPARSGNHPHGRLAPGNISYADYTDRELRDVLGITRAGLHRATDDPHAFFAAWRYLQGMTQEDVQKAHQSTVSVIETSDILPSAGSLPHYVELMNKTNPGLGTRFEDLVIGARLRAISYGRENLPRSIGQHLSHMPARYWQRLLDAAHGVQEPADSNLPAWADDALPIATKGEYLRALRNLSGDSREQLAERC